MSALGGTVTSSLTDVLQIPLPPRVVKHGWSSVGCSHICSDLIFSFKIADTLWWENGRTARLERLVLFYWLKCLWTACDVPDFFIGTELVWLVDVYEQWGQNLWPNSTYINMRDLCSLHITHISVQLLLFGASTCCWNGDPHLNLS